MKCAAAINMNAVETIMKFTKPLLPYMPDSLEPVISATTVEFHYGKHEDAYVNTLNSLIENTDYEGKSLEEIICSSDGKLFNNASQAWNHIFYFLQFNKRGQHAPGRALMERIETQFGSLEEMQRQISEAGVTLFGSGWVWLSKDCSGQLIIQQKSNAGTPLTEGLTPILVIDVWEHAYYLDYQNRRADYLKNIWEIIDWSVIDSRYEG